MVKGGEPYGSSRGPRGLGLTVWSLPCGAAGRNENIVNGGGDESSRKSQMPAQIPSYIFDPSLINPHYGINDRQPVNPVTNSNPDMITPFLQAMIANQKQNQQQQIIAQPTQQPTQPIPIKPTNTNKK